MHILILIELGIFGLCLGSFVNALVWRFHAQAELREGDGENSDKIVGKKRPKALKNLSSGDLSISKGRSMCTHCHHALAARDLIPVVSYLWLRGRCRYCGKSIQDTPLAELAVPVLFIVSYLFWPTPLHGAGLFTFVLWLIFLVGFTALSLYDLRWYELPHRIVLPLIGLALLQIVITATVYGAGWPAVVHAGLGALVLGGGFWLLYVFSPSLPAGAEPDGPGEHSSQKPQSDSGSPESGGWVGELLNLLLGGKMSAWIGFGDITLGLLLGLLVGGPGNALLLIFIASLIGTVIALPLLLSGHASRTSHLPFGPFLMMAVVIVKLWGASLLSWYLAGFVLN